MSESLKGSLEGIKVIDFSTLLPGPLASLFLVETGAEVIKIEKPDVGDEIRLSDLGTVKMVLKVWMQVMI